jgi:hypothetical protein
MDIGFEFFKGLALGETSRQRGDFSPESTLLGFVDNSLENHAGRVVAGGRLAILIFSRRT